LLAVELCLPEYTCLPGPREQTHGRAAPPAGQGCHKGCRRRKGAACLRQRSQGPGTGSCGRRTVQHRHEQRSKAALAAKAPQSCSDGGGRTPRSLASPLEAVGQLQVRYLERCYWKRPLQAEGGTWSEAQRRLGGAPSAEVHRMGEERLQKQDQAVAAQEHRAELHQAPHGGGSRAAAEDAAVAIRASLFAGAAALHGGYNEEVMQVTE